MNSEAVNEISMKIISYSGTARSDALVAMKLIKKGDREEALKRVENSQKLLNCAHEEHTQLLVVEARDEKIEMTLLLIHASNIMSNAEALLEIAKIELGER